MPFPPERQSCGRSHWRRMDPEKVEQLAHALAELVQEGRVVMEDDGEVSGEPRFRGANGETQDEVVAMVEKKLGI